MKRSFAFTSQLMPSPILMVNVSLVERKKYKRTLSSKKNKVGKRKYIIMEEEEP